MENPIKMDDSGVPLFLETPFGEFLKHQPFTARERDTQDMVANASTFSDPRFINDGVFLGFSVF